MKRLFASMFLSLGLFGAYGAQASAAAGSSGAAIEKQLAAKVVESLPADELASLIGLAQTAAQAYAAAFFDFVKQRNPRLILDFALENPAIAIIMLNQARKNHNAKAITNLSKMGFLLPDKGEEA